MKERPILMSAPMVRAILDGKKEQTRRAVKPQPPATCEYKINGSKSAACCYVPPLGPETCWVPPTATSKDHLLPCPYGKPGDRLWVRETFYNDMPRWTSRITLQVNEVRVERLHEITEKDALDEGFSFRCINDDPNVIRHAVWPNEPKLSDPSSAKEAFRKLWGVINGDESWALNPWVWVVSFEKLEASA